MMTVYGDACYDGTHVYGGARGGRYTTLHLLGTWPMHVWPMHVCVIIYYLHMPDDVGIKMICLVCR